MLRTSTAENQVALKISVVTGIGLIIIPMVCKIVIDLLKNKKRLRPLFFAMVKKIIVIYNKRNYSFNKWIGCMIEKNGVATSLVPCFLKPQEYNAVVNPLIAVEQPPYRVLHSNIRNVVRVYAKILTWLSRHSFMGAYVFSKLLSPRYEDAQEAVAVYYRIIPGEQQRKLCLARMLFASSMSKRFKKHGIGVIGAFLPSRQMHAWVMEDGRPADRWDNEWICYQPVAVIE